jgi:peptide/nickel transport system permease protein
LIAYIWRRLGILIIILFGSSFILYNLAAISGDPAEGLRGSTDPRAKQQLYALIRNLQLNVPPPARYFIWLKGILGGFTGHLDFGKTRDGHAVTLDLASAIPTTIRLIFMATVIAIILGITVGIVSALRQYSRFDYAMTFVAFLMFSLPIFWVAVLLKQYLAISFNNFLVNATISPGWILGSSLISGIFWAGVISGDRSKVWKIFGIAAVASATLSTILSLTKWFAHPGLGPIVLLALGIGVAFAVTLLSTGLQNKNALKASLAMPVFGLIFYYPVQKLFTSHPGFSLIGVMALVTITVAVATAIIFSKIDRGPIIRTTVITSVLVGFLALVDKLMRTWQPYMQTDAINNRPIPTSGQSNPLLGTDNFWFTSLDTLTHLFLPTIALTLISFAGYIRYSRGTLLDVLNQDYIRTARAKGLNERTVIMRHAFRNTLIPLTTIIVVDFAAIIGGAIITEHVFGWVGMGTLFNKAINGFDLNLLMGVFFITATLSVLANLVADLLYSALDPRIRVVSKS